MEVFAQYCHKRVEKMAQSGAKKGVKKPAVEEIIHAKVMLKCRLRVWELPVLYLPILKPFYSPSFETKH